MSNLQDYVCDLSFVTREDTSFIFVSVHTNFYLHSHIRKDGTSQVYLDVNCQGQRHREPLKIYIEPKNWLKKQQRARKGHDDFNLIIDNIQSTITEIKTQFRLSHRKLSLSVFMDEFRSDFSRLDFLAFLKRMIEEDRKKLSKGTYRRYLAVWSKLSRYKSKILFSDFTYKELDNIKDYLRGLGNSNNTIMSNLRVIKSYLNRADRYGIKFPIDTDSIKIRERYTNRRGLTAEQVKALYQYYMSDFIPEEWKLILGYFLFSCFTGLRIGDVLSLEREKIRDEFRIKTKKTGQTVLIKLTQKAKAILAHQEDLFVKFYTPEHINRELKLIAKAVNIEKPLTFHYSRHTFAVNFLRQGGQVVYLQKLLGHSSIKTTMVYVQIVEDEQNNDIFKLDNMF